MSKEIAEMFEILLNKSVLGWHNDPHIVETLEKIKGAQNKRFAPPTLNEVALELRRLKVRNPVQQAEKFWNFYEAKNWMIGKNKMKSWKAAIKTWNFEKDSIIL